MKHTPLQVIAFGYSGAVGDVDYLTTEYFSNRAGLRFGTIYPGGLYSRCEFFVPSRPPKPVTMMYSRRVQVRCNLKVVWEGEITSISRANRNGLDGLTVICTGYWGSIANKSQLGYIWVDNRIEENIWAWQELSGTQLQFNLNRDDSLLFSPGNEVYVSTDYAAVRYTMMTGRTINRISYDYDLQEGAQNWYLQPYDVTHGSALGSQTASGTGTFYGTPASNCTQIELRFRSGASQTGDIDNLIYGKFSNVKIYGYSGTVSSVNVIKTFATELSGISDWTNFIDRNGDNDYLPDPCFINYEPATDFMTEIAALGDSNYNSYAVGLLQSGIVAIDNYTPVIYFERYPITRAFSAAFDDLYDYIVPVSEMLEGYDAEYSKDELFNYIIVKYQDELGNSYTITPADDSALQDSTSISTYGQREKVLDLGDVGYTNALNYAKRYLEIHSITSWNMTKPITIKNKIMKKGGAYVPAFFLTAGQRILIPDRVPNFSTYTSEELRILVNETSYDDETETLTIRSGYPDPLASLSARMKRPGSS